MEVVYFTLRQSLPSRNQGPTTNEDGVTRTPESRSGRFTENRTPYFQSIARIRRLCVLKFFLLGNIFIFKKLNRLLAERFAETLENIFCLSNICTAESRAKQLCRCLFERTCRITGQMALHHTEQRQTALVVMKNGGHVARSIKQLTIDPQSLI